MKLAQRRAVPIALRERGNGGEGTIMAGLRVIAHMGNNPARIFCIIRGGFLAMIVK